jgi:maltose O-acetyltransferase
MKSEKDKMLGGELYDPRDPQLAGERRRARLLLKALNESADDREEVRARIVEELFSAAGERVWIEPPFDCDYGSNIKLGRRVFFNFNCAILDVAPVSIGNNVLFGPAVQLYTATYLPMRRNDGRALNSPSRLKSAMTCGSGAKRSSALGYASVGGQSSARAAW